MAEAGSTDPRRIPHIGQGAVLSVVAVISSLLLNEVKSLRNDVTSPIGWGLAILSLHSFAYYALICSIICCVLSASILLHTPSLDADLVSPITLMVLSTLCFLVQSSLYMVSKDLLPGLSEASRRKLYEESTWSRYLCYSIPQYLCYTFLVVYGLRLYVLYLRNREKRPQISHGTTIR